MISRMRFSDRLMNSNWQMRGRVDQALRLVGLELALEFMNAGGLERLHGQQGVNEEAVAQRRRNSPGRGVRAGNQAHLLEVAHHVAHRCR